MARYLVTIDGQAETLFDTAKEAVAYRDGVERAAEREGIEVDVRIYEESDEVIQRDQEA